MKTEAEAASLPVWDRQGMLARLMDDQDLAQIITDTFLADIPQQIQVLKQMVESGNAQGAELRAHTIKGAAALMGGEQVRDMAFRMEKNFKAQDLANAGAHIAELETRFQKLKAVLNCIQQ